MSRVNQEYLDNITKDTSTFHINKISTPELKRHLDMKRELVKHHEELRIKGMSRLAEIRQRKGDESGAKAIRKISKAESNRRNWKEIQGVPKPHQQLDLATIKIPHLNHWNEEADNPEVAVKWQRVSDPSLIEDKLLIQNIKPFGQNKGLSLLLQKYKPNSTMSNKSG
jgi:hypothetical protein